MKKILISHFEPFDSYSSNSGTLCLEGLSNLAYIDSITLPVVFQDCWHKMEQQLKKGSYDYVIALGQADARQRFGLEKVAINYIDAGIPDNKNHQPRDVEITPSGAKAYFSDLPLTRLQQISSFKEKIEISYSAGTYVCNFLFYKLMEFLQTYPAQGGFFHIPIDVSQAKTTHQQSLPIQQSRAILREILQHLSIS